MSLNATRRIAVCLVLIAGCFVTPTRLVCAQFLPPVLPLVKETDHQNEDHSFLDHSETNLIGINLSGANLSHTNLRGSFLTGANFSGANLSHANLGGAYVGRANLDGADVTGASFGGSTLTVEQLQATTNYQDRNLVGVGLGRTSFEPFDLSGIDFQDFDLSGVRFGETTLTGANLSGALVAGAGFEDSNLTFEQLQSTASYQQGNLAGISLGHQFGERLAGWDLHDQNLSGASIRGTLTDFDLSGADLSYAHLGPFIFNFDLSNARLVNTIMGRGLMRESNLIGANLSNATLSADYELWSVDSSTIYNQWTVFPRDFDPVAEGLTLVTTPLGDFNADGLVDGRDLTDLQRVAHEGDFGEPYYPVLDLNEDSRINQEDVDAWLLEVKPTQPGDADLNGTVEFADFLILSENFGLPGHWAEGDFDFSGNVGFADFLIQSQNFGQTSAATVPEPSCGVWLVLLVCTARRRRRLNLR